MWQSCRWWSRLRVLPDPRQRRGVRHLFVAVMQVAASAVVAGARSNAAIGQWSASAPQHALPRLGARMVGALGMRVATSRHDPADHRPGLPRRPGRLNGADPGGAQSLAVDGKTARGSRHGQTPAAHLLAAMTGDGRTVTSCESRQDQRDHVPRRVAEALRPERGHHHGRCPAHAA
ncbi:transposase family protein [Streptomyces sp. NPDC058579]|uniref:transposase family protein n=1 Tax=Streptomyces sp. NPDC058579 TaxID=3346548 RepID=UPI0036652E73